MFINNLLLKQVQCFKAVDQMTEHSELVVKGRVLRIGHEKLRFVFVRPGVCHAQDSTLVMLELFLYFVFEGFSVNRLAAFTGACRIASLKNKAFDVPVEESADVVV